MNKLSRELIPLKSTSVIKEKKRDLIEEAIRRAEEEEYQHFIKETGTVKLWKKE
jgi:hypothetical protein